ncbi:MAG: hypothetical protein ACJ73N_09720, partial [Bryobacteraceae bacterium]
IYLMRLADNIDPERTNISAPNIHKKILAHGFENDLVGRILLLAKVLFDKTHLGPDFDCDSAKSAAFEATKLLLDMRDIHALLSAEIHSIMEKGLLPDTGRSQNIPTVNDLETHIKTYVHKVDQVRDIVIGLFKLVYGAGKSKKILEHIKDTIVAKHGANSDLDQFFDQIKPVLEFTRNLRNGVEHPKPDYRLIILDFNPTAAATVTPPTVELVHADTPQPKMLVTSFMEQMNDQFTGIVEWLIVNLCLSNMGHFGGFECGIMELPAERRRHKGTRFSYAVRLNDQWQPLG